MLAAGFWVKLRSVPTALATKLVARSTRGVDGYAYWPHIVDCPH